MNNPFDLLSFSSEFSDHATAQGFRSELILETPDGNILGWEKMGKGSPIYISAGIHGDEPAGPLALLKMMKEGSLPSDRHLLICPTLNPYGLTHHTRFNRDRIDLNRDYLLRQSNEVAAHTCWLESKVSPELFLSLHEDWETSGFYFYEINLGADSVKRAKHLLKAVSPFFPPEPCQQIDGHEVREPGWIFHCAEADLPDSWPEAIYLAKQGCPLSFTLETPSQAKLQTRVSAHVAAISALLDATALPIR